jgi:hypothetical protein
LPARVGTLSGHCSAILLKLGVRIVSVDEPMLDDSARLES